MQGLRLILVLFVLDFSQAIDFCKIASCQGTEHIGCNNTMVKKISIHFNNYFK